jgi:hypothetical protein
MSQSCRMDIASVESLEADPGIFVCSGTRFLDEGGESFDAGTSSNPDPTARSVNPDG